MPDSLFKDVSIIIPAAVWDDTWRELVENQLDPVKDHAEVILSMAEEPDNLPDHVTWVEGRGRRAENMNDGAQAATRKYFWFIHADSTFDTTDFDKLAQSLKENDQALHYFDIDFMDDGPRLMPLNTWGANFRSRVLGVPFGDQAFCIHRDMFEEAGRYDETLPNSEDHFFVWQCRHKAIAVKPVDAIVRTSARRYAQEGWLYVVLKFQYRWIKDALPQFIKLVFKKTSSQS